METGPDGWVDEHVHLLSAAAARQSVDVSWADAPRLTDVFDRLRLAPASLPFVRAWGFDDAFIAERRPPTRDELDAAVPDRPLVLHHRSGHAEYRNTLATGWQPPRLDVDRALRELVAELAAAGIERVTDATPTNGPSEIDLFRRLQLPIALTLMVGVEHLDDAFPYGWSDGRVVIGPAKIAAPAEDIGAAVRTAHGRGWPAAVHVVELDELEAALAAFETSPPPGHHYDRIEHLALSLPEHVERLAALGRRVAVVTQPSFLRHRATKYREQLSEIEQGWLYRIGSLVRRGVSVAFSSDLPVTPSEPGEWIAAAVDRGGFAPDEAVEPAVATALARGL